MKCLKREELFAYSHHFLEPREEAAARAHVAACDRCRGALGEYQRLEEVLGEWEAVELSPDFDARLLDAMRKADAEPWTIWSRAGRALRCSFLPDWLRPASMRYIGAGLRWLAPACVLLVVVTASIVMVRTSRKTHPFVQPPSGRSVEVTAPNGNAAPAETAEEELNLYKELSVLENYDLLADFDVLSELHPGGQKVED